MVAPQIVTVPILTLENHLMRASLGGDLETLCKIFECEMTISLFHFILFYLLYYLGIYRRSSSFQAAKCQPQKTGQILDEY